MPDNEFTEEKAAIVVEGLRAGRRPASAARLVGVCRATIYNWRGAHEDFAAQWNNAVQEADDRVEQVIYDLAAGGDIQAAVFWLRHHRPDFYNRETMIKIAALQAQLTALRANGSGRLTIDIGPDGLPILTTEANEESGVKIYLPYNGREPLPPEMQTEHSRERREREDYPSPGGDGYPTKRDHPK